MIDLKSILVDIDAMAPDHPALEQAVELAARCKARVKVVDVLPMVPPTARHFVTAELEEELVDHRRTRLEAIAASATGVQVKYELLRGRPGLALTRDVLRTGHQLLVRAHERDPARSPARFGAVDMELLRQCPCPVWLIGRHGPHRRPLRLLAAVHANPMDEIEQSLNCTILEWALLLKELTSAQLRVLQAWNPFGASLLQSRLTPAQFAEFVEAVRHTADEALSSLLAPFGDRMTDVPVHLTQGVAEDVISGFVAAHEIDVVVMGTVARTGIAGLVMGNTAEHVLRELRGGSVLAVKPPGFESPVRLDQD